MEIRVYRSMVSYTKGERMLFCHRIDCPDAFDFHSTMSVFRSIFGSDVLILLFSL